MLATGSGNRRAGFTLLEVMVAFTILVVGILMIMPMTVFMIKANVHNKYLAQARLLAEQYAEHMRSLDYEDAMLSDDGDTTDLNNLTDPDHADTLQIGRETYFVAWNIKETDVKTINIIVSWLDPTDNRRHRVSFETVRAPVSR